MKCYMDRFPVVKPLPERGAVAENPCGDPGAANRLAAEQ